MGGTRAQRGELTGRTKKLRELYGLEIFREAVLQMVADETHDVGALALLCEQARRRRNPPVPLPFPLPAHMTDVDIVSHDLVGYDAACSEAP